MRFLILRPGALGDLLLALPGLRALEGQFPEARVEVAASHPAVLELAPDVDTAHDFRSPLFAPLYCEEAPPTERLSQFLAPFERVAVLGTDPDGVIRRRLAAHGVRLITGGTLDCRPAGPPHMAERLALELGLDGLPEPLRRIKLMKLDRPAGRHVWLHPGAGGAPKRWPLESFVALGRLLVARGVFVRVFEGPADEGMGERLAERLGLPGAAVAHPGSHVELAEALAGGAALVGNDSGPTHLAGLLGLPAVAVFGTTSPEVWAPCGPRVRVVAGGAGEVWPSPEAVAEALSGVTPVDGREPFAP